MQTFCHWIALKFGMLGKRPMTSMVLLNHLENVLHISEKKFTTIPVVPGEKKASLPYLVNVTIPVEGYDPVVFTLGKHCGTRIQL
jgi:hypothetical protein